MSAEIWIGIASIVTSVGTIVTVWFARKSFLADHERRKKQATIEFYRHIHCDSTFPLRNAIREFFGESFSEISYKPIHPNNNVNNTDLYRSFILYCRDMERFAVGINIGVFDFDTFNRFAGDSTSKLFEQIKPLIDNHRRKNHDYEFCAEFYILYSKLVAEQPKKLRKGDMIHSE